MVLAIDEVRPLVVALQQMSDNESNNDYSYVTNNVQMARSGHLVLYTVVGGRVLYAPWATQARELGLERDFLPRLRRLNDAFAVAKDNLNNTTLPALDALEGWEGRVDRKLKIARLRRGHEYVVQVEMRGRMRGKNHVESVNMFRLSYQPPEDFNANLWVENYMNSVWDEDNALPVETNALRQCIEIEPYWEDSTIDPVLLQRTIQTMMSEFEIVATSVDAQMLTRKIRNVLENDLGALPFQSGQGAFFVPMHDGDNSYLSTLERYSELMESFGNANALTGDPSENDWFGSDGRPLGWSRRRTNLRIMGYIDDERQMSYIKQDIETNIGREIAEYHQQLMEVTQGFNEDNIKSFERRLQTMQARKETLSTRLKNFSSVVGGDINLNTNMFKDVSVTIGRNVSRIRSVQSAAAQSIMDLAKIE